MHWERHPLSLRPDDEDQKYTVSVTVRFDCDGCGESQRPGGSAFETEGCKLMEFVSDLHKIGCFAW